MKTRSKLIKILTAAASVVILAAVGSVNAYASSVSPGFELPGILPSGFANFENTVKVKINKKGKKGFKLKVKGKGGGNYLNLSPEDSLKIKGGRYKLIAMFDPLGNFLEGTLKIKGKLDTDAGKAKRTLMTALLGSAFGGTDFAYTGNLLGFNTHDIVCNSVIDALVGGCGSNESVYISLEDGGFAPTVKNFKSKGLSVATITEGGPPAAVPLPAAVWLFGSGLIGFVGVMRRRKH